MEGKLLLPCLESLQVISWQPSTRTNQRTPTSLYCRRENRLLARQNAAKEETQSWKPATADLVSNVFQRWREWFRWVHFKLSLTHPLENWPVILHSHGSLGPWYLKTIWSSALGQPGCHTPTIETPPSNTPKIAPKTCERERKRHFRRQPRFSSDDIYPQREEIWNGTGVCWLVGCLTSQQQASVSQGRIC